MGLGKFHLGVCFVFIAGALSISALAKAQVGATQGNSLVIDGRNGPLLRIVSQPESRSDIDTQPFDSQSSERQEPPPAKAAPLTPVVPEGHGQGEARIRDKTEPAGPPLPGMPPAPIKIAPVKNQAQQTEKPNPIDNASSAERSRRIIEIAGSPGIDLSAFVLDLPENEDIIQVDAVRVDEAVAFALKNNFEIASARQKKIGARWEEAGAVGQFFPKAELTRGIGKQRSSPAGFNQNNVRIQDNSHHYRERVWTVTQPIIDLSLISDLLSRHNLASAASADVQGTREKVALDTIKAYYRLIMYSLTMAFAADYQKQLDGLTGRMSARVEGGGAAQAELDRIKARSLMVESSIIDAQNNLESTLYEFRRLTGVDAKFLVIPTNFLPFVPGNVEEIIRQAISGNPEFLTAIYRANAAEFDIATALNKSLPKLQFQVTGTRTYNSGGSALDFEATDGGPFAYQNERKAMMVLNWAFTPMVDIPQTFASQAKSREEFYKSVDIRKRVEEATRASFSAMRTAGGRIPPMQEAVQASAKVVDAFELQYQSANRSVLDLLDSYERLFQSKRDLVSIMTTEAIAGFQLRRQMGDMVDAVMMTENRGREESVSPDSEKN